MCGIYGHPTTSVLTKLQRKIFITVTTGAFNIFKKSILNIKKKLLWNYLPKIRMLI